MGEVENGYFYWARGAFVLLLVLYAKHTGNSPLIENHQTLIKLIICA